MIKADPLGQRERRLADWMECFYERSVGKAFVGGQASHCSLRHHALVNSTIMGEQLRSDILEII